MRSRQSFLPLFILIVATIHLSHVISGEEMCACSSTVCNCLRGNITNITTQVLQPYCKTELKRLVISDNNISQIDVGAFKKSTCSGLDSLVIRHNRITSLNSNDFVGLLQLKTLDIGNNNLTTLDVPGLFSPIENTLITLKAASNLISALGATTFKGLAKLEILNLEDNPLTTIHQNTFRSTPELRTLILSSNVPSTKIKVKTFPVDLFKSLKKLRYLNITALGISSLQPNTFSGLDSLEALSLQGNFITNFSREYLSNLPALQTLDLSSNRIHCLQASSFADLPQLTQLDLSVNRLTYITNNAFDNLSQLNVLNLDRNPIAVIEPRAFCSFRAIFLLRIDTLLGRVAYQAADNYAESAFAKLPNITKVFGLGSTPLHGMQQSCQVPATTAQPGNGSSSNMDSVPLEPYCPIASSTDLDWGNRSDKPSSRKYLLIIVAICVTFLLVAFAVIMSYRAWSKQKMREQDAEDAAEKQEMLERGPSPDANNGTTNPAMNGTTAVINHQENTTAVVAGTTATTIHEGTPNGDKKENKTKEETKPVTSTDASVHEENGDTTITAFGVL